MPAHNPAKQTYQPRSINYVLEYNKAWQTLVATDSNLREIEVEEVTKMLACGKLALFWLAVNVASSCSCVRYTRRDE